MSTPRSWSGGGRRQADKVRWSRKVTEMGWGTDKDEKGKKGGHTMTPHQFPLQSPNLPTTPTPIEANTFAHILDSPPHSPSPFQFPPQEVITQTLEEHPMDECSHLTLGSAPMSRTSPTDSGEILQQLVQH